MANLGFLTCHLLIAWCGQDLVGKVMLGTEPIQPDDVARAELVYATAGLQAIRLYSLQRPARTHSMPRAQPPESNSST